MRSAGPPPPVTIGLTMQRADAGSMAEESDAACVTPSAATDSGGSAEYRVWIPCLRSLPLADYDPVDPASAGLELADSTLLQTGVNIVKNMIGEGMYSLSYGLAAGATGVFPAVVLVVASGILSCYTFTLVGRLCSVTGVSTFKALAEASNRPRFAYLISFVNTWKVAMTCLALAMASGQLLDQVVHGLGPPALASSSSPEVVLATISVTFLFPLCLCRDLSFLSYTSLLGVMGEIWAVVFMQLRAADGGYTPEGKFHNLTAPEFRADFSGDVPSTWGLSFLTVGVLCTAAQAFGATYNAPKYYSHLRGATPGRFAVAVVVAHILTTSLNTWVMLLGYYTFGRNCQGFILENYAAKDPLALVAYCGVGLAVVCAFPLVFAALRDNVSEVLNFDLKSQRCHVGVTLVLLLVITAVGVSVNDVGLVNQVAGGVFGSLVSYVFPVALAVQATRFHPLLPKRGEYGFFWSVCIGGSCLAVTGGLLTVWEHT